MGQITLGSNYTKHHLGVGHTQARTQGGVGGVVRHPLETAGIDFYTFIVASGKMVMGVQIEILKNLGIDFYSGFRKKIIKGGGCKSKS